jgi:two-component system phosphate regulon sensor histidine kinase PhoR
MSVMLPLEIACLFSLTAATSLAVALGSTRSRLAALGAARASERRTMHEHVQDLEAEVELLEGEYGSLFERCGAAILVLDSKGAILRANPLAAQWLGMPAAILRGKSLLEASLSHDLQTLFDTCRRENAVHHEVRLRLRATETISIVSIARVAHLVHDVERFILIAQDITHLRYLETVRRDFVANVSHELRTPLTGIRAIAETLQNGATEDRSALDRFLKLIVNETDRLTHIANDLLVLTAAESRIPERESLDISDLACAVARRFEERAQNAGVLFAAEIAPGLRLWANRDQIEQIIVNLIDNAVKYTPAGGRVRVGLRLLDEEIVLEISDTGIGILQQDLPRVFERFYRVDEARSRESGGTGLGLAIVKHMAEAHGGHVTVESEFNRGSTFVVTLPVVGVSSVPNNDARSDDHADDAHAL